LYTKKIKRGKKLYSYYYHNIKKEGRVKNIFLGNNKEEALVKLNKLKDEHAHNILLNSAPSPIKEYKLINLIILLLIFTIGLGLFYFIGHITGLLVYEPDIVTLNVNNNVSESALVFVNVFGQEQSKKITDLIEIHQSQFIGNLDINLSKFRFELDPGTYSFSVSLVDNSTLLAIATKEIAIKNLQNQTNANIETPQETPNLDNITSPVENIPTNIRVESEVENEINSKGKVRVIIRKNQNINENSLEDLINLAKDNKTEKIKFVKDQRFSKFKEQIKQDKLKGKELAEFNEILRNNNIDNKDVNKVKDNFEFLIKNNAILDIKQSVDDLESAEITKQELDLLKQDNNINKILLDKQISLFVNDSIILTQIDKVQQVYTGNGKSVCILDTGINYNLFGLNLNSTIAGYDFVNNDNDPLDDNGHGTSVSNILLKVAPNAKIYSAKVINSQGIGYESDVLAGLQYCINNNVNVISFSIGSGLSEGFCDNDLVANKSNSAVDQGIYVVAATGNDASLTSIRSPSCASKVTRVSSSTKQDQIASFSNINNLIDLIAPGKDINTIDINGNGVLVSGTSFSVPLVSGSALLILENRSLSPYDLTYLLRSTSEIINYNNIPYNRLNLWNALINNKTNEPYNYTGIQSQTSPGNFTILASSGPNNGILFYNNGTGTAWTNPIWANSSDNSYATSALATLSNTKELRAMNFSLNVPTGVTINGINVTAEMSKSGASLDIEDITVFIVKNNLTVGTNHFLAVSVSTTDAYSTYGNETDLWGATWNSSDINNANFGVGITMRNLDDINTGTAQIDHIRIQVYYTAAATTPNTAPTFNIGYPQLNSTDGSNISIRNLQAFWIANDNENQTFNYSITWYSNNLSNFTLKNITYSNSTFNTDTLISNNLTKGQTWKAMIAINDGQYYNYSNTSELLILNTPPAFQVNSNINSTDGTNRTTVNLNVFFTPNETDVNDLANLNYSIQMFTNNISNFTIFRIGTTNGTVTNFAINNKNLTRGQTWKAMIWVSDGSGNSTYINTSELLILNTNPNITIPAFNQSSFNYNENINVSLVTTDGDPEVTNVTFEWFKDDFLIRRATVNNLANGTNTSDTLNIGNFNIGDLIKVQAFSFDGTGNSTLVNSTAINIFGLPANPNIGSGNVYSQSGITQLLRTVSSKTIIVNRVENSSAILFYSVRGDSVDPSTGNIIGFLENQTLINFSRFPNTISQDMNISWFLVNLSGVNVQREKFTPSVDQTQFNITINSINTTGAFLLHFVSASGATYNGDDFVRGHIVNATQIQFNTPLAGGSVYPFEYQVINSTNGSFRVEQGFFNLSSGTGNATVPLVNSVNTSKAFLIFSFMQNSQLTLGGQSRLAGYLPNGTSIQFNRTSNNLGLNGTYQVIEFADSSTVQNGVTSVNSTGLQSNVSLTTINTTNSVAFLTGWMRAGSSDGGLDNVGPGWFTAEINETQLKVTRSSTQSSPAIAGYNVISFNTTFVAPPTPNSAPTFTAFINTTDVKNNNTLVNLSTAWLNVNDNDGNNTVINLTSNWYENNQSMLGLNLPFEINTSNQVLDYSGFNKSATFQISTPQCSTNYGRLGKGCFFNGSSRINITHTEDLNFTKQFTIEAWVLKSANLFLTAIAAKGQTGGGEVFVFNAPKTGSNNFLQITVNNYSGFTDNPAISDPGPFPANSWQYIAATIDVNARLLTLYRNGTQVAQAALSTGFVLLQNNDPLTIGCDTKGTCTSAGWNGSIDDFRVWNRTLSADQIYQNYINDLNNKSLSVLTSSHTITRNTYKAQLVVTDGIANTFQNTSEVLITNSTPTQSQPYLNTSLAGNTTDANLLLYNQSTSDPDNDVIINSFKFYKNGTLNASRIFQDDNGLITYYPFDYGSVLDFSPNGHDGINSGLVFNTSNSRIGTIGAGFDAGTLNVTGTTDLRITGALTIEAWVYHKESALGDIVSLQDNPVPTTYSLFIDSNNKLNSHHSTNSGVNQTITSTNSVSTNTWHHVALVRTGGANNFRLYIDGSAELFTQATGASAANSNLSIGGLNNGSRKFKGAIDELAIYNIDLDNNTIYTHYQAGKSAMVGEAFVIPATETRKNENWTAQITPIYSNTSGTSINTSIMIKNTLPVLSSLLLNSSNGLNGTELDLNTQFNASDLDSQGEIETLNYSISWIKNNITNFTLGNINVPTIGAYTISSLNKNNLSAGDTWTAQIISCDTNNECSSYTNTTELLIINGCRYSSGNWNVNCYDNCSITNNIAGNSGANITISGYGNFVVNGGNISNFNQINVNSASSANMCVVRAINGGNIKK